MTPTVLDVGRTVQWTNHGHTHTGTLHRYPTLATRGRAVIVERGTRDDGTEWREFWELRIGELEVVEDDDMICAADVGSVEQIDGPGDCANSPGPVIDTCLEGPI